MKWSELPKEYKELEKGFENVEIYGSDWIHAKFSWNDTPQKSDFWEQCNNANSISELPAIPTESKDEKLELLKEIQEYFERIENRDSMPLWLADKIEKVINHNKTN
jgi:hypothetical protein